MLITLARKPLVGSVAQNALQHGCGALNIDSIRIDGEGIKTSRGAGFGGSSLYEGAARPRVESNLRQGRWPANILLDPTPDVLSQFPEVKGQVGMTKTVGGHRFIEGDTTTVQKFDHGKTDTGSAARFFKQIQGD